MNRDFKLSEVSNQFQELPIAPETHDSITENLGYSQVTRLTSSASVPTPGVVFKRPSKVEDEYLIKR